MAEASVGVGVHGPEVVFPFSRWAGRPVSAGIGKCCESGESVEQELPVWCGGGEFEPGPPRMAGQPGGDRKDL